MLTLGKLPHSSAHARHAPSSSWWTHRAGTRPRWPAEPLAPSTGDHVRSWRQLISARRPAGRTRCKTTSRELPPSTQRCWPPRGRGRSAAVRRSQATHSERASAAQKLQTIMRRLSGAIVRSGGLAPKSSRRGVRANAPWRTHCSATAASAHARGVPPTEWHRRAMRVPPKHLAPRLRACLRDGRRKGPHSVRHGCT